MSQKFLLMLVCSLLSLGGCNIIYKQNVQQGNAIEQDSLEQLKPGMTMNQVAFLMGTPAVRDPFHQQRWDYYYSFAIRGGEPLTRLVTLQFENSILAEITGVDFDDPNAVINAKTEAAKTEAETEAEEESDTDTPDPDTDTDTDTE
jgi:outer membrane protein assembly factor BamE